MFNLRSYITVVICAFVLTGCAATGGGVIFTPPAGSLVKLSQEVTARSGNRIFIQGGQVLERRDVTVADPHCQFSLDRSSTETRDAITIKPDTFTITEAYRQRDYALAEGIQYAGRAGSDRMLSTVMKLSSDSQPKVNQLVCSRWGMISNDGWLTISEMQTTLSGLVEIILAQ